MFCSNFSAETYVLAQKILNEIKNDELLISRSMLRDEGDLFLCQTSLKDLKEKLGVEVTPIEQDGASFVMGLLGIKEE